MDDDPRSAGQAGHRGRVGPPVAEHGPALQLGVHALGDDHLDVAEHRRQVQVQPVGVGAQTAQVEPDDTTSGARMPTISTGGRPSEGRSVTTQSRSASVVAS